MPSLLSPQKPSSNAHRPPMKKPSFEPIQRTLFTHQAELPLEFIIIGAGITGLACAYNLQQAGHRVRVLDRYSGVGRAPGGVRVPPNGSRLLLRWGLGPLLDRCTTICREIRFHIGKTGEHIGVLKFHKEVMKALEGEVVLMLHADLHHMLYNLAKHSGAQIEFNQTVTSVSPGSPMTGVRPSITLASGQRLHADMVIGADGGSSIVRPLLIEDGPESEVHGQYNTYFFSVPVSKMGGDEQLLELMKPPAWNIWMNDRRVALGHPARGGREFAVNFFWPDDDGPFPKGWDTKVPLSEINLDKFEPRIQKLASIAKYAVKTQHTIQPPLEDWFHPNCGLVVMGEAAHLLNPGGSHGVTLGLEDAAVFGGLFSRLRSRAQIPHLLSAFQSLRQSRCQAVEASEFAKMEFVTVPEGSDIQKGRDKGMKAALEVSRADTWDDSEESYLREQWEEFAGVFGYDAYDEADGWWVEWGVLMDRAEGVEDSDETESVSSDYANGFSHPSGSKATRRRSGSARGLDVRVTVDDDDM